MCMGKLSIYDVRSEYQIIGDWAEPTGVGALQLAFEQLKEKLAAEGLFDAARKKPLPRFPEKNWYRHICNRSGNPRYAPYAAKTLSGSGGTSISNACSRRKCCG